jgi:hypothetical protein
MLHELLMLKRISRVYSRLMNGWMLSYQSLFRSKLHKTASVGMLGARALGGSLCIISCLQWEILPSVLGINHVTQALGLVASWLGLLHYSRS